MTAKIDHDPGLEEVIAARTRLSHVDGLQGILTIGGFRLEELAGHATYEEAVYLLWQDRLPNVTELADLRERLAALRTLPDETLHVLNMAAARHMPGMDALRSATGTLESSGDPQRDAYRLIGVFPTIVAAYARLIEGQEPVAPRADLGHAANYLYMLTGEVPSEARVKGLETYFVTVIDHSLNVSTFAARVIISTQSDMISAITGAVGALKGPLHGGAPAPALDMVFEIGDESRSESYLRAKLGAGERLMGFGHRIYKVRDPRADVLNAAAEAMYKADGDMRLYRLARHVERDALRLLEEYKPGRRLQTNVEFFTALLLHGLGLPTGLFTPTFAVSRVAGWCAHCLEQLRENRIIRPGSAYVGEMDRRWIPIEER